MGTPNRNRNKTQGKNRKNKETENNKQNKKTQTNTETTTTKHRQQTKTRKHIQQKNTQKTKKQETNTNKKYGENTRVPLDLAKSEPVFPDSSWFTFCCGWSIYWRNRYCMLPAHTTQSPAVYPVLEPYDVSQARGMPLMIVQLALMAVAIALLAEPLRVRRVSLLINLIRALVPFIHLSCRRLSRNLH